MPAKRFYPALIVGALIRLPGMFQCLWYDESFTAAVSALPCCSRMWQATAGDVHPPLWYAIEAAVIAVLGNSEVALRIPALILGVANIWLTWRVAGAMRLPQNVAGLATLIVAVMPGQVWFSNEARMYQLVQCAGLLAVLGAYERRWWLYALGVSVGLWSHNLFSQFMVIMFLLVMRKNKDTSYQDALHIALAHIAIVLSYTPWVARLVNQLHDVGNGFWVLPLHIGTPFYALHQVIWASTIPAWAGIHAAFVSMLLLATGSLFSWKAGRLDLLALAFGQWALLVIASLVWQPVLIGRALMPSLPFLAMLLAYAFAGRRRGPALAILAAPVLVIALASYVTGDTGRQDMHAFAEPVRLAARSDDVVFHGNLASYMLMSYYLPDQQHYVWEQANDLSQSLTRQTKTAMGLPETDLAELQAAGIRRVWLYWSLNPTTSQGEYAYITAALATFETSEVAVFQSDRLIDARLYLLNLERIAYGSHRSTQQ